jgi:hypothetical protein
MAAGPRLPLSGLWRRPSLANRNRQQRLEFRFD